MSNEELKRALLSGCPVLYAFIDGCAEYAIKYKCVSGIIYRKDKDGKICITAELTDKNDNSRTIVRPDRISVFNN